MFKKGHILNNPLETNQLIDKLKKYELALTKLFNTQNGVREEDVIKLAAIEYFRNMIILLHRLAEINAHTVLQKLNANTNLVDNSPEELFEYLHIEMKNHLFFAQMNKLTDSYKTKSQTIILFTLIYMAGITSAAFLNESFMEFISTSISVSGFIALYITSIALLFSAHYYFKIQHNEFVSLINDIIQPSIKVDCSSSYLLPEQKNIGCAQSEMKTFKASDLYNCFFKSYNSKSLYDSFNDILQPSAH